jgi:hypothetical protein
MGHAAGPDSVDYCMQNVGGNVYLENQEEDGRKILRWMLEE